MKAYLPIGETPRCCCQCVVRVICKIREDCYLGRTGGKHSHGSWHHLKPNNCPLLQVPNREEAREIILKEMVTINLDSKEQFREGMGSMLDKLGFKE